ncbi:MAG: MFS transporter [Hyphomicrobiales bacterium]|nr:MFS transporter [Hyphomicrobiales bacterium]MCP5002289.1 MFS transporter [Hyphomicrobiales bacterium]
MNSIRPLVPLFVAAAILLAGNGLQGTLISLRGSDEGFSTLMIGIIGAAYFAGFMGGCFIVPHLLRAVGHIRTFSALCAIAASGTLLLVLIVDPYVWIALRFLMGLCFASLFTTVDSWLNSGVTNENRARVLSIYRLLDMVVVTGSQFLIPAFGASSFAIFAILAIMICMSLVPISLADRSNPKPPSKFSFSPTLIWHLSPIACIGCVAIGLTNATFRMIGPIYAQTLGLPVTAIATFMGAGILGGAVLQYPFGILSDRYDRRIILLIATAGATLAGLFINGVAGSDPLLNYIGIFVFGAFSLPLFSLSAAHANDHANKDQYVHVAAGLIFFWSAGATIGPFISSALMQSYGPSVLFTFTSSIHGALILVTLWRMRVRAGVPRDARGRYHALLRTSLSFTRMASKEGHNEHNGDSGNGRQDGDN